MDTFCENPVYQHKTMKNITIITINDRKVRHEKIEEEVKKELGLKPEQAIFLSKHTSQTGKPSLTVHPIGNYGKAELGGKDKTLVKSSPKMMAYLLRSMKKNAREKNLYHKVSYEVTHHGPYMTIPTLFVEVGSTEEEWKKTKPAEVIGKTVVELIEKYQYENKIKDKTTVLVGMGGGHYAPRFTDVVFEKNAAFGHMIPGYQINAGNIDEKMFEQAIEKTPDFKGIYIHKKSMKKSQVSDFKKYFENKGISVISSKDLENL